MTTRLFLRSFLLGTLVLFIFPCAVFAQNRLPLRSPIIVHMLIYEKERSVNLRTDGAYSIFDKNEKIILAGPFLPDMKLIAHSNGFFMGNKMIGDQRIALRTLNGAHIFINGEPYSENVEFIINGKGTFFVLNNVGLERYLEGVLAAEISSDALFEAIKAQAIISRTFTIFSILGGRDNFNITKKRPQVFKAVLPVEQGYKKAIEETFGQILLYNDRVIPTFFSAVCGGETEFSGNVWDLDYQLPPAVKCPYCQGSRNFIWKTDIPIKGLRRSLSANGIKTGKIESILPKKMSSVSDRITELVIQHSDGESFVRTGKLRSILGTDKIRSTLFSVGINGDNVRFTGRGWGHGVGLCQAGAAKMAAEGKSCQEILQFYYQGTEVKKMIDDG